MAMLCASNMPMMMGKRRLPPFSPKISAKEPDCDWLDDRPRISSWIFFKVLRGGVLETRTGRAVRLKQLGRWKWLQVKKSPLIHRAWQPQRAAAQMIWGLKPQFPYGKRTPKSP